MKRKLLYLICFLFIWLQTILVFGQEEISFRGLIKQGELPIIEQEVYLLVSILNAGNSCVYEEESTVLTNSLGVLYFGIGSGIPTINSELDDLSEVNWSEYPFSISVSFRLDENDEYQLLQINSLNAVVYSYYAKYSAGENVSLNSLFDVDSNEILEEGYLLRSNNGAWDFFNGEFISLQSGNSINSLYSDSAGFAFELVNDSIFNYQDTIAYSFIIDSVSYSYVVDNTVNSVLSVYSDTSLFADSVANSLMLFGNQTGVSIGSSNEMDFHIITNSNSRFNFLDNGSINIGDASVDSGFAVHVDDGFLIEYLEDSSANPITSSLENAFYWNPRKRSMHFGNSQLYQLPDSGLYSFTGGYNNYSNSFSFSWGENNIATGNNVVTFGKNSSATRQGLNQYASGVAIGDNCYANRRCVALGDHVKCIESLASGGNSGVAIGKNITSSGSGSTNLGIDLINEGLIGSTLIGKEITLGVNYGTFIFADSNSMTISGTNDNQFIVVASGGSIFYTDTLMLNGVSLSSGSGSWSSVSDMNKKENIRDEDIDEVFNFIQNLEIYSWNYKTQSNVIKHIGPLSNDFNKNPFFSIQKINSYNSLSTVDMDGIIMLAIKGTDKKINELKTIVNSDIEVNGNKEYIQALEERLKNLENSKSNE